AGRADLPLAGLITVRGRSGLALRRAGNAHQFWRGVLVAGRACHGRRSAPARRVDGTDRRLNAGPTRAHARPRRARVPWVRAGCAESVRAGCAQILVIGALAVAAGCDGEQQDQMTEAVSHGSASFASGTREEPWAIFCLARARASTHRTTN